MAATYFTEDHEWIRVEGGIATVGITDYAQEQLGDLVFVELPEVGQPCRRAMPLWWWNRSRRLRTSMRRWTAKITEANEATGKSIPALVNSSATGDGWLWKMKLADTDQLTGLLDEAGYKAIIG